MVDFLVGNGSTGARVCLTTLDRLQNVEVIQHVINAAVVRQAIEKRSHGFLCFHVILLR